MKGPSKHFYVVLTFLTSLVLIAAGAFGLYRWTHDSVYMTIKTILRPTDIPYKPRDILFLSLFVFATPTGFLLLLYTITYIARQFAFNPYKSTAAQSLNLVMYILIMLLSIGTFGTLSFHAYRYAEKVLKCGFAFCLDEERWDPSDVAKVWQDSQGFRSVIAAPLIMISFALAVTFILMILNQFYRFCCTPRYHRSTPAKTDYRQPLLGSTINAGISSMYEPQQPSPTNSYTPYNTYYQITRTKSGQDVKPTANTQLPYFLRMIFFTIIITCLWLTILFFASYIPNSFRFYWPRLIAINAAQRVTNETLECIEKGAWICAERLDALLLTQSLKINPNLILKLFPSNLIFYIFTLLAITFPIVARAITPLDRVLQKKFKVNAPTIFFWHYAKRDRLLSFTPTYWSLYEVFFSIWLTIGSSLFFFYWFSDHNWKTRWPGSDIQTFWDNMMRTSGQVAVLFLSLLMFPVARSSPLLQMMGIGWDKGINFHRWAGVAFVLLSLIHVFASYATYFTEGGWPAVLELLWPFPPIKHLENPDNFTIPLIQPITILMFITIGIIAIYEPIRRAKYDFFLMCHHITYITLIPAVIWHAQASWEYLTPALSLYLSDRLFRLYRGSQAIDLLPTTVSDFQGGDTDYIIQRTNSPFSLHSIDYTLPPQSPITSINSPRKTHLSPHANAFTAGPGVRLIDYGAAGKYVELKVDNRNHNIVFMPGNHFFYVQIAEISLFEWHPMTTAGHCHAQGHELSFLIKCEGHAHSWTNNLYNYIDKLTQKQLPADPSVLLDIPLTVCLDGPYGDAIDFNKYDNIVLIAGGSGITPAKSIYNSLWLSFVHDFIATDTKKVKLQRQLLHQVKETHFINNIPLDNQKFDTPLDTDDFEKEDALSSAPITLPKHVHLFFAARDPSLFECLADSLSHIPTGPAVPFTAELLCSKQGSLVPIETSHDLGDILLDSPEYDPKIKVFHNLAHHISKQRDHDDALLLDSSTPLEQSILKALKVKSLSDIKNPSRTLFFACGPHRLTKQAKEMAIEYGFHHHEESFEL